MPGTSSIHEFLREARKAYTILPHRPAFTAQEEAAVMHVPGRDWAKVVVCLVEGEPIQAVVPAPLAVNLDRLLELAGGKEIRLAQENELGCIPVVNQARCHPSAHCTDSRYSWMLPSPLSPRLCSARAHTLRPFACVGRTMQEASGRSSASLPSLPSTTLGCSGCRTASRQPSPPANRDSKRTLWAFALRVSVRVERQDIFPNGRKSVGRGPMASPA